MTSDGSTMHLQDLNDISCFEDRLELETCLPQQRSKYRGVLCAWEGGRGAVKLAVVVLFFHHEDPRSNLTVHCCLSSLCDVDTTVVL